MTRLDDQAVSAALHYRLLQSESEARCPRCGDSNEFAHPERCPARPAERTYRHERVKNALASALKTVKGATVQVEPRIDFTARRNDVRTNAHLRVRSNGESNLAPMDYDVSVISLFSIAYKPGQHTPSNHDANITNFDKLAATVQESLTRVALAKRENLPTTAGPFTPIILSSGGMLEKATEGAVQLVRKQVGEYAWKFMILRISLGLVRSRAANFIA